MSTKAEIKRKKELKKKAGYVVKVACVFGLVILGLIYYNSGKGGTDKDDTSDTYSIQSENSRDSNQNLSDESVKKSTLDSKTGDSSSKKSAGNIDKNAVVSNVDTDNIKNNTELHSDQSQIGDMTDSNGSSNLDTDSTINIEQPSQNHYDSEGRLNINYATVEELCKLNGIGEKRAADIVDYRETSGGFKKIEDIMKVKGIKQGVFSKIRDYIYVD